MFEKLLFTEMRTLPVKTIKNGITDTDMIRVITDNENLISLGYCLKPEDIVKLAKSGCCIYDVVKQYVDKVKADPMYPDFPEQVMEMSEAQFRFDQIVHYFSTYGMKALFGVEVDKGWLPDVEKTEKTKEQEIALPAKTISLIDEKDQYLYVLKKLLTKRERLTNPEKDLIKIAAQNTEPEKISEIPVAFKENLMGLFVLFFEAKQDDAIYAICQHTGDVLTCLRYLLTRKHYKLSTSERKRCVRILERYPAEDFKANLILSNKKAKNSFIVLDYLSYNKFSRSIEHKLAVKDLRDGNLHSWESALKKMLSTKDEKALPFVAKRPGMLVRMVAWLLRLEYDKEKIKAALCENAEALSTQTLVSVLTQFGTATFAKERPEAKDVFEVLLAALVTKMQTLNTPIKGKKVFLEEGIYDFALSRIETNDKSEEGGYVRSGLVFNIPDEIKNLRFFVYWNDQDRVDVDLHVNAFTKDNEFIHVGWDGDFNSHGVVHSGDITHSDAAEYIDIAMDNTDLSLCCANLILYSGKPSFGKIDTCFCGMMGVSRLGKEVKLYNPANCFFYHDLKSKERNIHYALIDAQNRKMQVLVKPNDVKFVLETIDPGFSVMDYLTLLCEGQGASIVETKEDADLVIRMDKGADISLIDENYFMDC